MILAPEGSSSGKLRIPVAQERDAGIYTCRAVNELGDASAEIQLAVGHAPQLTELPRDVTVELGRSALLACRATGRPPPMVTWPWRRPASGTQAGGRARQQVSAARFGNVAPEDQALYVCEARNVFGKVQAEAQLIVTGHAPPQIASSAPTVRVLEGQPVSLPCIVLAGRPLPERHWLKDGRPLPSGNRHSIRADGSLHLDRALQEHAGRYRCVATNTAGSRHRDVELVVQVPPRIHPTATHHITNEGVPASLPCVASGVPTPTITWTKETNALTSRGPHYNVSKEGTLLIAQPSAQDTGAYVCTATNTVGFSSQEMWLSVNTKPRIHMNGSHNADVPLRVTAKAGEEVTLDCEAEGSPPPLVTWTKDSHPVPPITNRHGLLPSGSLRLAQVQVGDSGHYECTASNPAGSTSRRYVLGVQGRTSWQPQSLPVPHHPACPSGLSVLCHLSLRVPLPPPLATPTSCLSQACVSSSTLFLHLSPYLLGGPGDTVQRIPRTQGREQWGPGFGRTGVRGEPTKVGLRVSLPGARGPAGSPGRGDGKRPVRCPSELLRPPLPSTRHFVHL
uniref:Ig-like domain-containing protein n=1 Tax=Macaca fascicularis TaxID=9541 RepID=A0A2K5U3R4_MACFA